MPPAFSLSAPVGHGLREFVSAFAAGRKYLGIIVPQKAKAATTVKAKKK